MISMRLVSRGKAAHSAFPSQGKSAIESLLDALQKIRDLDFGNDLIFGESLVNIGTIKGGEAFNIIADYACAEVSIRCAKPSQQILDRVKEEVEGKVNIEVKSRVDPQKLYTVTRFEQIVLPYGTDIPHLKNFGKPLLLGPGSALVAHTEYERIEKGQLSEAVQIYKNLAKVLLASHKDEEKKQ
jgi:acetylornithine deacetylase